MTYILKTPNILKGHFLSQNCTRNGTDSPDTTHNKNQNGIVILYLWRDENQ